MVSSICFLPFWARFPPFWLNTGFLGLVCSSQISCFLLTCRAAVLAWFSLIMTRYFSPGSPWHSGLTPHVSRCYSLISGNIHSSLFHRAVPLDSSDVVMLWVCSKVLSPAAPCCSPLQTAARAAETGPGPRSGRGAGPQTAVGLSCV